jgi:Polyketide cyclase / dehydrase and lipid transport
MKPIEESTVIRRPIEDVFDHIDVLANHESFNDHYLVDWELWGPATGVGATVRMRAKAPGRSEWVQLSVIEAERPVRSVEETVGAGGRRRTRGTYTLAERDPGTTEVRFTLTPVETPALERLLWPLSPTWLRGQIRQALDRLRDQLERSR